MALKTIEQERAQFAFDCVNEINEQQNNKKKSEYKSYVKGFGSMILQNGLGQALAFLKAKQGTHLDAYQHINRWLAKHFNENNFDILQKITAQNSTSTEYRLYTKETLAFLVWLRKFAEAELSD